MAFPGCAPPPLILAFTPDQALSHRNSNTGWKAYATMKRLLTFVILSFVLHHSAAAAVIYSGLQNIAIPTNFDGVYLNIDNAATSSSPITGWEVNFFFGGFGIANSAAFQPGRSGTGNMDPIVAMTLYDEVGGATLFSVGEGGSDSHMGSNPGQFQSGIEHYLGFKFVKDGGGPALFGSMRVELTVNQPGGVIRDWSWEDSGSPYVVPEPGRAALLLIGLTGLVMQRRRVR